MKRKSHIITRIALAATVFVTTLAGVAPMTALAASSGTTKITVPGGAEQTVTLDAGSDGSVTTDSTYDASTTKEFPLPKPSTSVPGVKFEKWSGTPTAGSGASLDATGTKLTFEDTSSAATYTLNAVWTPTPSISPATKPITFDRNTTATTYSITGITVEGFDNDVKSALAPDSTNPSGQEVLVSFSSNTVVINNAWLKTYKKGDTVHLYIWDNYNHKTDVTFTIDDTSTPAITYTADPATATVAIGGTVKYTVKPSATTTATISGVSVNGTALTAGSDYSFDGFTVTLLSPYTKKYTAAATDLPVVISMSDGGKASNAKLSVSATTGTEKKLDYIKWATNGANLGDSFSYESHHTTPADKPASVYLISSKKYFDNGATVNEIKRELEKSSKAKIKLVDVTEVSRDVVWDYAHEEADVTLLEDYDQDKTSEQSFIVYSEPIAINTSSSDYYLPESKAKYIRLKLNVVVRAKGDTGTKGSGNVAAPTFSPVSGTVVTPGTKITFSSTTSGVSFRSQSGTVNPTTSSGTAGAQILIPSGASAGEYKLNAIAYTSSSAYSDVASATYTVVTDTSKYTITEGNGQTASSAMPATFTGSGDLGNFKALYVDDVIVPETLYTKSSGSTIITLSPTYLQTLSAGNHTVKIVYSDGYATGNFTLTAGGAATPINEGDYSGGGRASTGTDDKADLVILFVLFGMVLAGFVVSVYYRNEKIRNYRD